MSDYVLMAPFEDEYSSMSDYDINDPTDGLKLSETDITPQIAGQWLYNVKAFRWTRVITNDEIQSGTTVENLYAVDPNIFPPIAINDLKVNPQLHFYNISPPSPPQPYLKASTNNDLTYYTGSGLANRYLEPFAFIKNRLRWCVGIGIYVQEEGVVATINASLTEVYTKFEYPSDRSVFPYDPNTIVENTYTITDTFYP